MVRVAQKLSLSAFIHLQRKAYSYCIASVSKFVSVKPVARSCKAGKISKGSTICMAGKSEISAGDVTQKTVLSYCRRHLERTVVTSSLYIRPKFHIHADYTLRCFEQAFFTNMKDTA